MKTTLAFTSRSVIKNFKFAELHIPSGHTVDTGLQLDTEPFICHRYAVVVQLGSNQPYGASVHDIVPNTGRKLSHKCCFGILSYQNDLLLVIVYYSPGY